MKTKTTNKEIKRLLDLGMGRRRIAKTLGITEWAARELISKAQIKTAQPRKDVKQKKTAVAAPTLKRVSPPKTKVAATQIRFENKASVDETDRTITIRPTNLKVGVVSDIHYPYQDIKSEEITLAFMKDYKPDALVWNGDIFDFYAVSSYEKSIKKKMNIQEEIDYGYSRMQLWVNELPGTKHYFRIGNHEDRLRRMIMRYSPPLEALRSCDIENNVDFESLGVKFVPDHQDFFIGDMLYTHGHFVRKHGGNSARAHFEQYGCSVLIGHTHRLAVLYKRNKFGTHAIVENGTLCDFDVEYAKYPDWQQGFTTLEYDGDDFAVTQHPIIDHKLIANGKVYMS